MFLTASNLAHYLLSRGLVTPQSIVAGDFMDLDGGQVSIASPIGRGLLGAAEGEEVTISLPVGDRVFKILELKTLPQQLGMKPRDLEG